MPTERLNSSRVHLERRVKRFASRTKPGMLVLDVGAGPAPYRSLFDHAKYAAADFAQVPTKEYTPLDYICDVTDIPVEDGRFDRILFNQVLEHLPDPPKALAELYRILKPGGRLFCSVPLFYEEHERPYDFFRYTEFALRRLYEEAGFRILKIEWLEGYFGTVSYQYWQMSRWLPRNVKEVRALGLGWKGLLAAPVLIVNRWLAERLDTFYSRLDIRKKYEIGMPKNYVVVVAKDSAHGSTI